MPGSGVTLRQSPVLQVRSLSSHRWFTAVAGFAVTAALTIPFFLIGNSTVRLVVALAASVVVAVIAAVVASWLRREETRQLSERRRAEEWLAEAERRYADLVTGLPLVTWLYAPGDRNETRLVAPQIEALVGYPPDQWTGELLAKILHPDDCDSALAEIAEGVESGRPFQVEYRVLARDGRLVWIREHGRTISGADGEPAIGQSLLLDIGDRKQVESDRDRHAAAQRAAAAETAERQSRLDLLHGIAEATAFSLDYTGALERVAELVVRELADWCVIDLAEEGAPLKRVVIARREPTNGPTRR